MRLRSLRFRLVLFSALAVMGAAVVSFAAAGLAFYVHEEGELAALSAEAHRAEIHENRAILLKMARAVLLAAPLVAFAAAVLGAWLAGRALAPLEEAGQRARAARRRAVPLLLPVRGLDDEWDVLACEVNDLLQAQARTNERARAFSANAAHELRTPLTALLGEVQVALRRDRTPGEYREALGRVEAEVNRLSALVEILLTLSRADSGNLGLRSTNFDLGEVATRAAESARARLGAGRSAVQVLAAPALVHGDVLLTSRILENLVDNALRHGAKLVRVSVEAAGSKATATVADDGPGIPSAVRARLFERFNRMPGTADGFGLGLSIAHAVAVAQRGRLWLVDEGTRSTTFVLELPGPPSGGGPGNGSGDPEVTPDAYPARARR